MSAHTSIKNQLQEVKFSLDSLVVYRQVLEDEVIKRLLNFLDYLEEEEAKLSRVIQLYNDFFYTLIKHNATKSWRNYVIELILFDENPFSRRLEIDSVLKKAIENDLRNLQLIANLSSDTVKTMLINEYCQSSLERRKVEELPEWTFAEQNTEVKGVNRFAHCHYPFKQTFLMSQDWAECVQALQDFYRQHGSGLFARYAAFVWEKNGQKGYLRGIPKPDPIRFADFVGYDSERTEVINNTLQFLKGFPANNVLLYGDRGTGKSSTVKALINEYYAQGLRMIEVAKKDLIDFPEIIYYLQDRNLKFIIFVDDLAFEDNEDSYTALKAVLEGSLENRPSNVLIYATSNRRHLIKEKFSDRAGLSSADPDEEVRAADTIEEKLSLSDRFGITVIFTSPQKQKYLEIVEGLAAKRGLKMDREYLHREALKWELWYNGRSPRTARQFIDWLEGQEN